MRYELTIKFTGRKPDPSKPARCVRCGCTEEHACEDGCSWVDDEHLLCSACLDMLFADAGCKRFIVHKSHDERGELLVLSTRVRKASGRAVRA